MASEKGYEIQEILREMRDEYWHGIAEGEEERADAVEHVVFLLGGERYAMETGRAAEVIRLPKLVRVPKAPAAVAGVFNLRGAITAAVDLRPLLGVVVTELPQTARILVLKADEVTTGLIVEKVIGVEELPTAAFEPGVRTLSGPQREFVRGHFTLPTGLVMLLDVDRILASPGI